MLTATLPSGRRLKEKTTVKALVQTRSSDFQAIMLATLIGTSLLFVAGFSHAQAMHDVAHDSRHAMSFPCH